MSDKIESIKNSVIKAGWNALVISFQEQELVRSLSFKDVMALVHKMIYSEGWNEEWQSDWRNYAFLGIACDINLRYDESYEVFKNAYDRSDNRSPELAWQLARF